MRIRSSENSLNCEFAQVRIAQLRFAQVRIAQVRIAQVRTTRGKHTRDFGLKNQNPEYACRYWL